MARDGRETIATQNKTIMKYRHLQVKWRTLKSIFTRSLDITVDSTSACIWDLFTYYCCKIMQNSLRFRSWNPNITKTYQNILNIQSSQKLYTILLRIVPPPLNSTHQPPISPANLGWVVHDIFQQFEQGDITCFLRLGKTCDCKFATNAGSMSFQLNLMIFLEANWKKKIQRFFIGNCGISSHREISTWSQFPLQQNTAVLLRPLRLCNPVQCSIHRLTKNVVLLWFLQSP